MLPKLAAVIGCLATSIASSQVPAAAPVPPVLFHASLDGKLDAEGVNGAILPAQVTGRIEYRPGRHGQALLCGGDAALVKYPVTGNLRSSQGTIEMWVQPVDWPEDDKSFHIFFETDGPGWLVLYKYWSGGLLMLSGADAAHYRSAWWEAGAMGNGAWHHLAGVWNADRLALFVDGVKRAETPLPLLPQGMRGDFTIGDAGWGKPHSTHTLVEDVRIYRYALLDEQISFLALDKPIPYQPELPVAVEPHPARGEWRILVDASGYLGAAGGTQALVEIIENGKTIENDRIADFADGVGRVDIDISEAPPGVKTVRASVLDTAGRTIVTSEVAYEKPPAPPWQGTKVGLDDRVLPPFTKITVGGSKTVECWGRRYAMNGPFPTQIESAGQPMLAGPIILRVAGASGDSMFGGGGSSITGGSPTRATHAASAAWGGLDLGVESTIEYDGMAWFELTVTPRKPVDLDELTLHIPVRSAVARYIHHIGQRGSLESAGSLPDSGYAAKIFEPFLWLGDDDRGLAWFAEKEQGWSISSNSAVEEVKRTTDAVEMRIHFINRRTRIDKPLRLAFGLQATPVKPRPADARSWRLGNLGDAANLATPGMGTIQIIWSNGNLVAYGYPWPKDPVSFRKTVNDLHSRNIRVVPYVNLNFFALDAPEWSYYSPDFRDLQRGFLEGDVGEMGRGIIGACPHSPEWRDMIAYKIAAFVTEFQVDGIYVDSWTPTECAVEDHGCGWRDSAGTLHGLFTIRDSRELVRRVREVLAEGRQNPHILIHMSGAVCIPMLSFGDSMLDGEQYRWPGHAPTTDYLQVVPLDKWRAENTGTPWGIVPFFLPEFDPKDRVDRGPTDRLMGLLLMHDCSPWPIWCNPEPIFDAWRLMDDFGATNARFLPYWKPNFVTTDNHDVLVSLYQNPGAAMLVFLNTRTTESSALVTVDAPGLGLGRDFSAETAVDHGPLPVSNGAFKLTLPGRDHRLVLIQAKK